MVKRVHRVNDDGSVFVVGDNPHASTDSREFGSVARGAVVGRVIYRYAPRRRAGRLSGGGRWRLRASNRQAKE